MGIEVAELDKLLEDFARKKLEKDLMEENLTNLNKEMLVLKNRVVAYLKEANRENYDSPYGKVIIKERWTVNNPKDPRDKELFFEYLRAKGIFEQLATVNHNSLNAFVKKEYEEAERQGLDLITFSIPGLGPRNLYEDAAITIKRGIKNE